MNLCKQPREVSLGELDWCAVHKVISGSWRAEMCEPRSDPLHQFHSLHPYKLRLWDLIRRAVLTLPCAPQTGSVTNHPPTTTMLRRLVILTAFLPVTAFAQSAPRATPSGAPADPTAWRIDKTHSELTFQIRHFMSRVRGTFRDWKGTVTLPDPAKWESAAIDVQVQTASVFTDNDRRDADLRSSNFF